MATRKKLESTFIQLHQEAYCLPVNMTDLPKITNARLRELIAVCRERIRLNAAKAVDNAARQTAESEQPFIGETPENVVGFTKGTGGGTRLGKNLGDHESPGGENAVRHLEGD